MTKKIALHDNPTLIPKVQKDLTKFQRTGSSLVQVMAWHQIGAKPLPEPVMTICQLNPYKQTSINIHQNTNILFQENALKDIVDKKLA